TSLPASATGRKMLSTRRWRSVLAARFRSPPLRDSVTMFAKISSNVGPLRRKPGVLAELRPLAGRIVTLAAVIFPWFACFTLAQAPSALPTGPKPHDISPAWKPWIGEYTFSRVPGTVDTVYVLSENGGFAGGISTTKIGRNIR